MKKTILSVVLLMLCILGYTQTLINANTVGNSTFYFYNYEDYKPDSLFFGKVKDSLFALSSGRAKNGWQFEKKGNQHYLIIPSLQFFQTEKIADIETRCASTTEGVEILVFRFSFTSKEKKIAMTRDRVRTIIEQLIEKISDSYVKSD
jgi:hypothetical protein